MASYILQASERWGEWKGEKLNGEGAGRCPEMQPVLSLKYLF